MDSAALDTRPPTAAPPLAVRGVRKRYGPVDALAGVDLALEPGRVTAVLGANGAGKTTLIRCALGLTRPSFGELTLFGGAPGSSGVKWRLGVMLQDADLPDLLTPREHLTLFASYYPDPEPVDAVIARLGLQDFADRRYGKLSGGQKRRTQFALALIGRPELVFLDEPTTGLDADARRGLWAAVRDLAQSGKTVVLTTHYLEEADSLADRIVVLDQGRVVADGPTDAIRTQLGGSVIRCVTRVAPDAVAALAGVTGVFEAGRFLEIRSANPAETLAALLAQDPMLTDLTVAKPSLEDAFRLLTQHPEGDTP
ncbi:MAG: ATP-binding cassette domain-containing protein [Maricaulaceae bacterium]